jgi:hypothetical protein
MEYFEVELRESDDLRERELLTSVGAYSVLSFVASLRGPEGFMLDLSMLLDKLHKGKVHADPHIVAPLLGRFKGETGEKCHLLPMASVTHSGLEPRLWLERLATMHQSHGRRNGPAFSGEDGKVASSTI